MPLGPSAAAAVEIALEPVTFTSDSFGFYANLDSGKYTLDTPGVAGAEMWARFRVQNDGVLWDNTQVITGPAGTQSGTYTLNTFTSTNPAEDGTTLVAWSAFASGPDFLGNIGFTASLVGAYWVYVQIVDSGGGYIDHGYLRLLAQHSQIVSIDGVSNMPASIPQGSTRVGIRGPNNVRGRTRVEIVLPATDSITNAPDMRVLTAVDGVTIQCPLTAEVGEPGLVTVGGGPTWTKTAWSKLHAPAGSYRFHHDPEVNAILAGGVAGSMLGVYSGPPNAGYADLTFLGGGHLRNDPITGQYLAADETVTIAATTWLYIQSAYLGTYDGSGTDPTGLPSFHLSWEYSPPPTSADPDPVVGHTRVLIAPFLLEVDGFTTVQVDAVVIPPTATGVPDQVYGTTSVEITAPSVVAGVPDPVTGSTTVAFLVEPDLSDNPPIIYALELTGDLVAVPGVPEAFPDVISRKTQPLVVVTMPTPITVAGRPVVPRNLGVIESTSTGTQGPGHIRAMPPAPVWDGSGYTNPPPATTHPWVGRWVVDDLPDPPSGGFYWLGTPSSADGTSGIAAGKRLWAPHASTPHAPSWHSIFPFKPSVRAVDSFLPGGSVVHHPKGVHFNRQFIEHMWMDWGGPRRQPFTWVIACILASFPSAHYEHYVLDAGRNPDAVGFPRISDSDTSTPRTIHDGLPYRSLLSYSPHYARICARPNENGPRTARVRSHGASRAPRMLYGVYNGGHSIVGDHSPSGGHRAHGTIDNTSAQHHRYYVLGRANGVMSQERASHVLVFEIRFWDYALTEHELDEQYAQLSSTYHFNRYRRV